MTADRSTVRGREIARRLKAAQEAAGLNLDYLRKKMQWRPTHWTQVVNGERQISGIETAAIFGLCSAEHADREKTVELCQVPLDTPLSLPRHRAWTVYLAEVGAASQLFEFHPGIVPWMVQTAAYTHALVTDWGRPSASEEIKARRRLVHLPPTTTIIVHEWALCTPVGDDQLMADQLGQLLQLSALEEVTIRVLPAGQRLYQSQYGGFSLLSYPEYQSVAYFERQAYGVLTDDEMDIRHAKSIADTLTNSSLSESQSRQLIRRTAVELYDA